MMRIIAHTIFGSLFVGGTIAGTAVAAFAQQAPPWSVPLALPPGKEAVLRPVRPRPMRQRSKKCRTGTLRNRPRHHPLEIRHMRYS